MITNVPLRKLMPSPRNVRRTSDEPADLQLKADIAARGLLQNLVVAPAKKPRGTFTVEACGRRLAALRALAGEGRFDADHPAAERIFAGEVIAEVDVKANALAWVPAPMRFVGAPQAAPPLDEHAARWEAEPGSATPVACPGSETAQGAQATGSEGFDAIETAA